MENSTELLFAMELIKRAEVLQDRAAGQYAAQERSSGVTTPTDTLRAEYKQLHPYKEFLPKALQEARDVAAFIETSLNDW